MVIVFAVVIMAMGAPDGPGTSTYKKFNCKGCCGNNHRTFSECSACGMTGHLPVRLRDAHQALNFP
jgi:hypothetical protein